MFAAILSLRSHLSAFGQSVYLRDLREVVTVFTTAGLWMAGVARASGEIHDRRADVLDFEVAGSFAGYTTSHVNLDTDVAVRTLPMDVSLESNVAP